MSGAEVAQLYVVSEDLSEKPVQLRGFQRVELDAGASQDIHLRLSPQQLAYYDKGKWLIQPGRYEIRIGASTQDIRLRQTITLTGKKCEMERRTVFFSETK
jgi:beta-glucosidase